LLGVPVTSMTSAFLKPRLKVGRETVNRSQTKEQVRSVTAAAYVVVVVVIVVIAW